MISYLNDQKVTDKIVAQVGIMADSDKLSSEDLIEHTVQAEEQKQLDDKIKGLSKLNLDSFNRINELNKAVDTFSQTLSKDDFHKAIKLQKDLKKKSLAQTDAKLMVHTTDIFEAGFKQFPQIS